MGQGRKLQEEATGDVISYKTGVEEVFGMMEKKKRGKGMTKDKVIWVKETGLEG